MLTWIRALLFLVMAGFVSVPLSAFGQAKPKADVIRDIVAPAVNLEIHCATGEAGSSRGAS